MSRPPRSAGRPSFDFERAPFLAFWETTRACDLACQHCRASAVPNRDDDELDTEEGKALLDEILALGCRLVVLTGGDPAKRPDLVELVQHGTDIGLRVALTPSATPLVTSELLRELKDAGLARLAISLDGVDAETHDAFRGISGSYDRTLEILKEARELGLTTQVNTSITPDNEGQLEGIAALIDDLDLQLWGVFVLVPTGRARLEDVLDPEALEGVLERLADISERSSFDVKTTAAPQFRRVLLQRKVGRREIVGVEDGIGRAPRGVNDGQGIVFVSHVGEIQPSGFLPLVCGNVRSRGLTRTYRDDPVFQMLREPELLGGKCGPCEFKRICGGSRARAFAMTANMLAEEPSCNFVPTRLRTDA
jgi:AdoMet-dependent heme synthase